MAFAGVTTVSMNESEACPIVNWHSCHDLAPFKSLAETARAWAAADKNHPLPTEDCGKFLKMPVSTHEELYLESDLEDSLEEVWQKVSSGNGTFLALRCADNAGMPVAFFCVVGNRWAWVDSSLRCYSFGVIEDAGSQFLVTHTLSILTGATPEEGENKVADSLNQMCCISEEIEVTAQSGREFFLPGDARHWEVLPGSTVQWPQQDSDPLGWSYRLCR
jgi:hypothetical protein